MEKAKINGWQLFVLIILFELGTAIVINPGLSAEKDAWLAVLFGLIIGVIFFLVYYVLYRFYPECTLIGYSKEILGKYAGFMAGVLYFIYFLYIGVRDLRDFGELLTASTYNYTPLFIINAIMILTVAFVLHYGIEVLARTGEIFFLLLILVGAIGTTMVFVSGEMDFSQLLPVLENGWGPVLSTVPLTYTFPFGEMIVFTMLLPYLNRPQLGIRAAWPAMGLSGMLLIWVVIMDITILGVYIAARSTFPMLAAIGLVDITGLFQRLDVAVVMTLMIGGFFKIAIFFYAALISAAELFKVPNYKKLIIPFSIVILISSMAVASSSVDHNSEGLDMVTYYISLPVQMGIPIILLITALIRRRLSPR
ncbi:GerAB/ArcD/ProY family transporter [Halobacillus sp. A5]|uniref:GerAB/ArcD/ProY family transporter n=1 Tax=Halobacillus sp. A5 TaxID=2880263 RepID=UPI0020A6215D|nr:GerAB/ArcD/ProY family transporter [Halobacillus sp. A5]MCP3026581.1 spore germination protein [Halobacillus sp. A5]